MAVKLYFSSNSGSTPVVKPQLIPFQNFKKTQLSDFVGENSWKIFNDLQISDTDWLLLPENEWKNNASYLKIKSFVSGIKCVNDSAERHIKLIQDYVLTAKSEEKRQSILISASQSRAKLSYDKMTKGIVIN